jgi:hypothetical protein
MGPYLAQPATDKAKFQAESNKLKLRFARCEMQGTEGVTKDGDGLWRIPPSQN